MTAGLQPHIRLGEGDRAEYALLPGDPQRVCRIKGFLEHAREIACNREFRTASGYYKGIKILVTSTGIGGASTGIAVEELGRIGVKGLIRIGSCGALQGHVKPRELIIATAAVRDEGASAAYVERGYPAVPAPEIYGALRKAALGLNFVHHCGIVRSHDSFYTSRESLVDSYWAEKGVLGADMESAALFVIGNLRNMRTGSILNVVVGVKGELEAGISDYAAADSQLMEGETKGIRIALEAIVELNHNKVPR